MEFNNNFDEYINDYGIPVFYDNRDGLMRIRDTKEFFEGSVNFSAEVWKDQLIEIRGEISKTKSFLCGYCKQPIYMAGDFKPYCGQKRMHFRHFFSEDAKLCKFHGTHPNYSHDEIKRMLFNGQQESPKHKFLKRIICESFMRITNQANILKEPVLRNVDGGWRKPDVLVQLPDKSIVFEVQLTYIFLSTILERNEVHRKNNRYVIWIFSDFGDGNNSTLDSERLSKLDIFSANNHNAFVLDQEAISATIKTGELYLNVYYRDYYIDCNQLCTKLNKKLIAFSKLTFDDTQKIAYLFDSKKKHDKLKAILAEEELLRLNQLKVKQETDCQNLQRIINQIFAPTPLSSEDYDWLLNTVKESIDYRTRLLGQIYNFTSCKRWNSQISDFKLYHNSIIVLTDLYDSYTTTDSPSVMTCLKRCWENIGMLTEIGSIPDMTVELLFSPILPVINFHFFDFISSQNHVLSIEQRTRIEDWLSKYHKNPTGGKSRYLHFYAWMILLNNKVRVSGKMPLKNAQSLMREKYKVIRAVISLAFNIMSGCNKKEYRKIDDIIKSIENKYSEYAALAYRYIKDKTGMHAQTLINLSKQKTQATDLAYIIHTLPNRT